MNDAEPAQGPGLDDRSRLEAWIRALGSDFMIPPLARPHLEVAPREPTAATNIPAAQAPSLEELASQVANCEACPLHAQRTQTVFADGNPAARIFFVGEGPGADEDRTGVPFVGKAGQLLTRMIEGAMGIARKDVYIANVLKCRPPGNRNPSPEEQASCGHFLQAQIEKVDPEILICLGAVAAQHLLQTDLGAGKLRGKVHQHAGRPLIVTWHPAYLLRNPSAKREGWEDIRLALRTLGWNQDPPPYRQC
jgi:uracil-DNA glycosylase